MTLENWRPPAKLKLAALWASVMSLYIYGDYFYMYQPGKLEAMAAGKLGPLGSPDPMGMLAIALMLALPALMIALSVLLPPALAKWLNILCGLAYSAIVALTMPGAALFYQAYSVLEIALTLSIAWVALRWPRAQVVQ